MATLLEFVVEMEDGTTTDVVADQRDMAKWEIQPFGCAMSQLDSRMNLAYRWLAWSAMSRRGMTDLKWDAFDAQCIEVRDLPDPEDAEPTDVEDPGQPAPSAAGSSRSRGGRGSR